MPNKSIDMDVLSAGPTARYCPPVISDVRPHNQRF
jgi:hypothetical protein